MAKGKMKSDSKESKESAAGKKIIIELDKHLEVHCEGMTNLMEILGMLALAKDQLLEYGREQRSTLEMIEH